MLGLSFIAIGPLSGKRQMGWSCSYRVYLTTDTCLNMQNINYMVLITHFVDQDWKNARENFEIMCDSKSSRGNHWQAYKVVLTGVGD